MNIPLVDLKRFPSPLYNKIQKRINTISKNGTFILGNEVEEFEYKFSKYINSTYCISVASGTDAILLSLKVLGIEKNDEVIVPAMTFIATATPISQLNARPILVDIKENSSSIDPNKIEKAITKKTKAIIIVHLNGYPCDISEIESIAKKHRIPLIEDACQAHGSEYKNRKVGSFGLLSAFSFYPGKNLGAFGDAGAIVTSNKNLAQNLLKLRNHGQAKKYEHDIIGYNSRLDTIQAAVLIEKLKYLDAWNMNRRGIANYYKKQLSHLPIKLHEEEKDKLTNYHLFVIRTKKRNQLLSFLAKNKIYCGVHYPYPLHLLKAFKTLGYKKGDFSESESYAEESISLPIFPGLKKNEIQYICNTINNFFDTI